MEVKIRKEEEIDKADNIAKKITEQNPKSRKILIIGQEEQEKAGLSEPHESFDGFLQRREEKSRVLWDAVVPRYKGKTIDAKKLGQGISKIREEGAFNTSINLGIRGYGRFGKESLRSALASPLIKDIHLYSKYYIDQISKL